MRRAQSGGFARLFEPLGRVVADRLQHPEALLGVAQEALLDEGLERVQIGAGDLLGRLHGVAAVKDGEAGEEALLVGCEQFVRPLDRRSEGLLAGIGVPPSSEEVEALRQALKDLGGGEDARPGGGQLDREREAVEAAAELLDRRVGLEPGSGREQLDRLRRGERDDGVLDLAAHPEQLSARHQQSQVRTGLDERSQLRRGLHYVLQVVEQEQHLPLADMLCERTPRAKGLGHRLGDQGGIAQRRQPDPEDAVSEVGDELRGRLDREAGLARAARAGEREEASAVAQQGADLGDLPRAADEGARGPGKVGVRDRLQRRKGLRSELEDPDRLGEVLQAVLAEVERLGVDDGSRRRREQHLPAVPGGRDPRPEVDVAADIALVREHRLARVQAHPQLGPATRADCASSAAATAPAGSPNA
ncbi:MAG: hypothetical protein WD981_03120 [Gaiellaceae bacterium]